MNVLLSFAQVDSESVNRIGMDDSNWKTRAEERWEAYLIARDRAERSRNFKDGVEAGKAWKAFLDEFVGGAGQ